MRRLGLGCLLALAHSPLLLAQEQRADSTEQTNTLATKQLSELIVRRVPSVARAYSVKELTRMQLYNLPSASGDILRAVTMMGSTTNLADGADPEFRGSGSSLSRVVLNEVPIYRPVRNMQLNGLGNFSLFQTELIDKQNIYPSNPPLIYGNATAGVVEINTLRRLRSPSLMLNLSMASLGVFYAQPLGKLGANFVQTYANWQYSPFFLKANNNNDALKRFASLDGGFNLHIEPTNRLSFNIYAYALKDSYRYWTQTPLYSSDTDGDNKRSFGVINLAYRWAKSILQLNLGYDLGVDQILMKHLSSRQRKRSLYSSLGIKTYFSPRWMLHTGLSVDYAHFAYNGAYRSLPYKAQSPYSLRVHQSLAEGFAYMHLRPLSKLSIGLGLRANLPTEFLASRLAWQANARYELGQAHSLLVALGSYFGYALPQHNAQSIQALSTKQYTLDYLYHSGAWEGQIGVFHKRELTPITLTVENPKRELLPRRILGLESSLSYNPEPWKLSLSYILLNAEIQRDGTWHRAHNKMSFILKPIISYTHRTIGTFGLSALLHSGAYYTPILGRDNNSQLPIYGRYNSYKRNVYASTDLSYNKLIPLGSSLLIMYLQLSNIFDRGNERSVLYDDNLSPKGYLYHARRTIYAGLQWRL